MSESLSPTAKTKKNRVGFVDAIMNSLILVFVSEMGDKTQLLALVLAAKYGRPCPIIAGIFVATLLNHALASYVGVLLSHLISPENLKWILAACFIGFGIWMLIPDKEEELKDRYRWGPFVTTCIVFFIAEMGDKTQFATVALAAKFSAPFLVTVGSTLGMMAANVPAVFLGSKFTEKIPMNWVHRAASVLFILFGIGIAIGY